MYNDNRSGGYNQRPQRFAPVNVGDEVDVRIEAVGEKGDGIAKIKGFVLFIPNTKENQTVKVRITKVLQKVGFAEVIGDASGPVEEDKKPQRDLYVKKEDLDRDVPQDNQNYENTEDFGEEESTEPEEKSDDDSNQEETAETVEESNEETPAEESASEESSESEEEKSSEE